MAGIFHAVQVPKGAFYLFRGLKIIFSGWDVFKFAIAPFVVNVFVFTAFFFSFNYVAYNLSEWIFDSSSREWYWALLSMITGAVLFAVSIAVAIFGFAAVGLIIASPFNDLLSAAVERKLTGRVDERKIPLFQYSLFVMRNETKKMLLIIWAQVGLALTNLFPGAGQAVFAVASPMFMALVMAYEFTGYTLDRRAFSFRDKRMYILSRFGLSLGFGLVVGLMLMVPIVNFALMPVAAAAGAIFVAENPPEKVD